jgi:type II secretory pathway component PulM
MPNEWHDRIRGYLSGRSTRERSFLLAGGLALLVLLGYGLLYEPQDEARSKLIQRLPAERAELRLMRVQAEEIQRLRSRMGDTGKGGLEQRVKSSAAALGLGESFAQFVTSANDQIQISTQPLPTDTWIGWLAELERQGVMVVRCRITASDQSGLARLEMTLTGGQR